MTSLSGLPAPLSEALAAKGYASLTPVQAAVLAEGLAARDLLVSAQTGSGKTVAFGLAIAPDVLGGGLGEAALPRALVIAPTRELALQVRREFEWLYAGAVLASCVGGMDYRTERRALERGAHIVVGTPGRLRDHVERGSLKLQGLKAVVLDEADEMLDLGFREDLEFLLSQAAAERRTLMFSATVPPAIAELAAAFQKDAARIVAEGEARQHADIAYHAFSVPPRDREGAIFNLLRFHEAKAALVFCKTRANVNHLAARMGNRGFKVVALSGEFSQEARTLALQSLRDGRARVCIATDVAARGIDLPGLDLVIHADLPANAETLLHRSGRTGRAGAKGISALVCTPADFRKAQRLLREAKVEALWGKPPSADEVQAREDERLLDHPYLDAPAGDEAAVAEAILTRYGAEQAAAAFVRLWREGRAAPEVLSDMADAPPPAPPRPRGEFGPSVWFSLPVGHEGRAEARWLLPKLCDAGRVGKDAIGAIRVQATETWVQIAAPMADRFADGMEIGPGLPLTRLAAEPVPAARSAYAGAGPAAAPRRPHSPREGEAPRKPYRPRDDEAPRKPSAPKDAAAARKPYPAREGEAPRKAWPPRDGDAPRRPWTPREGDAPRKRDKPRNEDGAPRKPYVPRDPDAPRKPYAARDGEASRKPYIPRDGEAPRKPYAPRDGEGQARKPRAARDGEGAGRPFTPRDPGAPRRPRDDASAEGGEAPRKPRWKGGKPPADRPAGGDKPAFKPKSAGFKSHGGGPGKPPRAAGFKSHKSPRPAAPPADPRDTSRRFTPPKPKG
jgi:ATP-dependent RNA helicase DeaD